MSAPPGTEMGSAPTSADVLVMGVVNVTPDSFSDGGRYLEAGKAVIHGLRLLVEGADILDVGGEATNPLAAPVSAAEELDRILPVIERLAAAGARVSVDTTKGVVAREAVRAGARIINDVSGGLFDPDMVTALTELADRDDLVYIAGHLRGRTLAEVFMPEAAGSAITWREVADELAARLAALPPAVVARAWVDPGLGFGKGADPEVNLALVRHAGDLGRAVGRPVVVGPSRKRFLRRLLGDALAEDPRALDAASVEACLAGMRAGAYVVRVHDVALLRGALAVAARL